MLRNGNSYWVSYWVISYFSKVDFKQVRIQETTHLTMRTLLYLDSNYFLMKETPFWMLSANSFFRFQQPHPVKNIITRYMFHCWKVKIIFVKIIIKKGFQSNTSEATFHSTSISPQATKAGICKFKSCICLYNGMSLCLYFGSISPLGLEFYNSLL